jgi:hypothetical protein
MVSLLYNRNDDLYYQWEGKIYELGSFIFEGGTFENIEIKTTDNPYLIFIIYNYLVDLDIVPLIYVLQHTEISFDKITLNEVFDVLNINSLVLTKWEHIGKKQNISFQTYANTPVLRIFDF